MSVIGIALFCINCICLDYTMIELEYSYWLVPVCVLLAGAISYVLYSKKTPWSKITNRFLFIARFVLLFGLLLLLLNPLLKQFINTTEEPKVILAIDNSRSMKYVVDSLELESTFLVIKQLEDRLIEKGYAVDKIASDKLVDAFDSLKFDATSTDLTGWIKSIQSKYENQNVVGLCLVSDGNFNSGIAPSYVSFNTPIYTVGVGDTTQKKDVELLDVQFNKIVYQGNKFPLLVDVMNHGYGTSSTTVSVYHGGEEIASKKHNLKKGLTQVSFDLDAEDEGLQKYQIRVDALPDEEILENNTRTIYFDVIDGKQKIAIVAPAPHPDLRAIRTAIEKNKNYEVEFIMSGVSKPKDFKYDLAIVHTPNDRLKRTNNYVTEMKKAKVPIIYVLGASSIVKDFSKSEPSFVFKQRRGQRDNVNGAYNSDFNLFSLPSSINERLGQFVPLSVPYGDIRLKETSQVLLYQQVGSVVTDKPLLYIDEYDDQKIAVWLADGIWQWQQQEFAINDDSEVVNILINNLVKFMSTKTDKRKFKFYPKSNEYTTQDKVVFETEIYNQVYERVYDEEIDVKLTSEGGATKSYTFVPSSSYAVLEISNLEEGLYKYEAKASIGDKTEVVKGTLVVKELQLEQMDQKANFEVLAKIAENSEGQFFNLEDSDRLMKQIDQMKYSGVLHQEEKNLSVINMYWILITVILLVSLEWFTRKYNGGY